METEIFCRELPVGASQAEIDARVEQRVNRAGALRVWIKRVGGKLYICEERRALESLLLDNMVRDPERSGMPDAPAVQISQPAVIGRAAPLKLTDEDYRRAAQVLGCQPAAIRAVAEVESSGRSGFLPDARPKILFESHVFSKLTRGHYDARHPDLSTAKWIRNYQGGAAEHDRLARAAALDREAALKAASWGKFQILGLNFGRVGASSVEEFVEAQARSEREHLDAFVAFILSNDLSDELRDRRWADFARRYNGPRYAENRYDEKMAEAYSKYA